MADIPDTNRIQALFEARLKGLVALAEESDQVDHHGERGALREGYLTEFLKDLLPVGRAATSGFIVDVADRISRQLDIIVTTAHNLPSVLLGGSTSLVPIEAALGFIEVKSTLRVGDFAQVAAQIESFKSMAALYSSETRHVAYLFAYDSEVSDETITSNLKSIDLFQGLCILGDRAFVHNPGSGEVTKLAAVDDRPFVSTLTFMGLILDAFAKLDAVRFTSLAGPGSMQPETILSIYLSREGWPIESQDSSPATNAGDTE